LLDTERSSKIKMPTMNEYIYDIKLSTKEAKCKNKN